jgi:hypothetical protein
MTQELEYRVRAVTRFIVTEHDPVAKATTTIAEVDGGGTANTIAEAFAAAANANPAGQLRARAVQITDAPPGKVMRCKVSMIDRRVNVASGLDEKGDYLGRMVERPDGRGGVYKSPDPTDPANWRPDGEHIRFGAVCAGFDKDGNANVEENRIFGYWSPSVNFDAVVRNEIVLQNLELGGEYYVDFIPAPKPEAA